MAFRLLERLYADPPMVDVWSEHGTVRAWLRVEAALAQAQADAGVLDRADADAIGAACRLDAIDLDRLWAGARNVGYPILPLVRMIADKLPAGPDGRVHWGATTQDIMDTALSLQLGAAGDRLAELLVAFGDALAQLTERHAGTVMPARTHAQQAVPTTFGAKTAVLLGEVARHLTEMRRLTADARVVSLFGAGGTNAALGPRSAQVRRALAGRLDLADTGVPWHVARDRVTRFGLGCATVAATCVRFAREVIDLSRTELGEVHEPAGHHRGASSTMPQKANPISSEAVIGFGVATGGAAGTLLRAMEAGHERAAGEWQIEWMAVPVAAEGSAAALRLAGETAAGLRVSPAAMRRNLAADGGLLMAEALMIRSAEVLGRERAHDLAYAAAERARRDGTDLVTEFGAELPAGVAAALGSLRIEHADYVGEAAQICAAAVREWHEHKGAMA
ncbi:lyase family protein [Plantactinospora sp. WMMC1484]|uniref:lyase family protein n=1 Tax=Plantactinospora sp. WMMC1484 TaxID=3404122 RepID=UPI003BF47E8D